MELGNTLCPVRSFVQYPQLQKHFGFLIYSGSNLDQLRKCSHLEEFRDRRMIVSWLWRDQIYTTLL